MDAFKLNEIQRMEKGGNDAWKYFFDEHPNIVAEGRTFEDCTIKERYEGDVGEEYKDRLTAKAEGREYDPEETKQRRKKQQAAAAARKSPSPSVSSRSGTPLQSQQPQRGGGRASPAGGVGGVPNQKERNEAYFAKLGNANATRPEDVPPAQGGKYSGFGGGLPVESTPSKTQDSSSAPGLDEFQKDPVAALTKGFGWFTTAVGRGAKTVNESYIQPTAKQLAQSDFAAQTRMRATQLGQNVQSGALGAAESFNRFVEGSDSRTAAIANRRGVEPERKDFWDDFASLSPAPGSQWDKPQGSLGTAAMRKNPTSGPAISSRAAGSTTMQKEEEGGDWKEEW